MNTTTGDHIMNNAPQPTGRALEYTLPNVSGWLYTFNTAAHTNEYEHCRTKSQVSEFLKKRGYDSLSEYEFHSRYPHLLSFTDTRKNKNKLLFEFINPFTAQQFNAKVDFYDPESNTFIEHKCGDINAQELLVYGAKRKGEGFNHSVYKQKAVQERLQKEGYNFVLVMNETTRPPKLTQAQLKEAQKDIDLEIDNYEHPSVSYFKNTLVGMAKKLLNNTVKAFIKKEVKKETIKPLYYHGKASEKRLNEEGINWCYEKDLALYLNRE